MYALPLFHLQTSASPKFHRTFCKLTRCISDCVFTPRQRGRVVRTRAYGVEHAKLLLSVHAPPLLWQIAEVSSNAVRMVKLLHSQHSSTLIWGLSKRLVLANSCRSLSTCTDPVDPLERSHHLTGPVTQWRSSRPYILLKPTQVKQ